MPLVTCPKCDQETIVPSAMVGLETTCLVCGATYTVWEDAPEPRRRRKSPGRAGGEWLDIAGGSMLIFSVALIAAMFALGFAKTAKNAQRDQYDRQVERWARNNPDLNDFKSDETKAIELYRALQALTILLAVFQAAGGVLILVGKGYRSALFRVGVTAAIMAIPINFLLMFML